MKVNIKLVCSSISVALLVGCVSLSMAYADGWTDDFSSYTAGQALASPWYSPDGQSINVTSNGFSGQGITDNGNSNSRAFRGIGSYYFDQWSASFKLPGTGNGAIDIGVISSWDTRFNVFFEAVSIPTQNLQKLYMYYINNCGEQKSVDILRDTWYDVKYDRSGNDWIGSYKESSSSIWTVVGSTAGTPYLRDDAANHIESVFVGSYAGSGYFNSVVDNVSVHIPGAVPEPSSILVLLTGAAGMLLRRKVR